jgi:hypothetical protein
MPDQALARRHPCSICHFHNPSKAVRAHGGMPGQKTTQDNTLEGVGCYQGLMNELVFPILSQCVTAAGILAISI